MFWKNKTRCGERGREGTGKMSARIEQSPHGVEGLCMCGFGGRCFYTYCADSVYNTVFFTNTFQKLSFIKLDSYQFPPV